MKKIIITFLTSLFLIPLLVISYLLIGPGGIYTSVDRELDKTVIVEKGMGLTQIAELMAKAGLVDHKYIFYGAALLEDQGGKLKAGEYLIPAQARPIDIIDLLSSGKSIVHAITIPEGLTVREIAEKIEEIPVLKGTITRLPQEGYLLPETYIYVYGDTKQDLIDRMELGMKKILDKAWCTKKENLPYGTPHEALTMASIIEKETGHATERSRVAAVFINRLKLGMRLQADPTVIYGITLGKEKLGRLLTKTDLQSETPYNTYVITGLPPHPIACPGRATLEAAFDPADTRDLYFVADGAGNHNFSENLDQHNIHVRRWRSGK